MIFDNLAVREMEMSKKWSKGGGGKEFSSEKPFLVQPNYQKSSFLL